jgi:hypothetical protein
MSQAPLDSDEWLPSETDVEAYQREVDDQLYNLPV